MGLRPMSDSRGRRPAIELIGIDKRFGPVHANQQHQPRRRQGHDPRHRRRERRRQIDADVDPLRLLPSRCRRDPRSTASRPPIHSSDAAIAAGIGMVHQHFMLVEPFTVLENVMLGAEGGALLKGGIAHARGELQRLEREYALEVDPDAIIGELPVGLQQRVEILKALYRGADTLILDEPTGVLTPDEADHLFRILRQLKEQGKTIILITHKLREIMAVTDEVSVMRRGEMVATREDRRDHAGGARRADGRPPRAAARREEAGQAGRAAAAGREPRLRRREGRAPLLGRLASRCAPARSSASPASPATASRSCSRCWPASATPTSGESSCTASRSPLPAKPTRRAARARASRMCRRTATAWASSWPSRSGRTPRSAITATRSS